MNVVIAKENLHRALDIVARAAQKKATLPILSNVLLQVDPQEGKGAGWPATMKLSCTNLEIGIVERIPVMECDQAWATTVPAHTLLELVGTLPEEPVSLTLNERTQTVKLRCGSTKTDIKGIDAEAFPPMPEPDLAGAVCIQGDDLKQAIKQVSFCAATDEARPILNAVKVSGLKDMNNLWFEAADGFRLAKRRIALESAVKAAFKANIPARALNELSRILQGDEQVCMVLPQGRGQVIFHTETCDLISQLIEGAYPDLDQVVPKSSRTRTTVPVKAFLNAVKQAEIFAREGNNICKLDVDKGAEETDPGKVTVSGISEETGYQEADVEAVVDGNPVLIAFNVKFLKELLDVIPTPNVCLETTVDTSPGVFKPVGDGAGEYAAVVMPMNLDGGTK